MIRFIKNKGYDKTKNVNVPLGGALTTLLSERIPGSTTLRVTHLSNDVNDPAAWSDAGGVTWYVKVNGSLVLEIADQLGYTSEPRELGEPIEVRGGDLLEVVGKNPSATTDYKMLISLKGEFGYWEA